MNEWQQKRMVMSHHKGKENTALVEDEGEERIVAEIECPDVQVILVRYVGEEGVMGLGVAQMKSWKEGKEKSGLASIELDEALANSVMIMKRTSIQIKFDTMWSRIASDGSGESLYRGQVYLGEERVWSREGQDLGNRDVAAFSAHSSTRPLVLDFALHRKLNCFHGPKNHFLTLDSFERQMMRSTGYTLVFVKLGEPAYTV